jgi:hypothetical protein
VIQKNDTLFDQAWSLTIAASAKRQERSPMPRKLNVVIALANGQHRIHMDGPDWEVAQLVRASKGLLEHYAWGRASMPERELDDLLLAWRLDDGQAARKAKSLLKESLRRHLSEFPNCPDKLKVERNLGSNRASAGNTTDG